MKVTEVSRKVTVKILKIVTENSSKVTVELTI
jgi:hypothetical protein